MSRERELYRLNARIELLLQKFASHNNAIDKPKIIEWLKQFAINDMSIAIKLLENTKYCDNRFVLNGVRNIYGQFQAAKEKYSNEYFCFFGSSGHSGSSLMRPFRIANNLRGKHHDPKCPPISQLSTLPNKPCSVLFVEDFIGTGRSVITEYGKLRETLNIKDNVDLYLGVMVATKDAIDEIEDKTDLSILYHNTLGKRDNIFSTQNATFNNNEKEVIKKYCQKTKIKDSLGFGDNGLLLVFQDSTPNNTIGVIRSNSSDFKGLFPRDEYSI